MSSPYENEKSKTVNRKNQYHRVIISLRYTLLLKYIIYLSVYLQFLHQKYRLHLHDRRLKNIKRRYVTGPTS